MHHTSDFYFINFQYYSEYNAQLTKLWNYYTIKHSTLPLFEDCILDETLQHRISWDTTEYNLPNSAYWYLIGGPGPSSKDTSIKIAGTFSFRSWAFSAKPIKKEDHFVRKSRMNWTTVLCKLWIKSSLLVLK